MRDSIYEVERQDDGWPIDMTVEDKTQLVEAVAQILRGGPATMHQIYNRLRRLREGKEVPVPEIFGLFEYSYAAIERATRALDCDTLVHLPSGRGWH